MRTAKIMKKVECPKEFKGWSLKLHMEVPEILVTGKVESGTNRENVDWKATLAAWGEHVGAEMAVSKLEEYQGIRFIDRARRLKVGTKNQRGMSDSQIEQAMKGWSFASTKVVVARKSSTEMAIDSIENLLKVATDETQVAALNATLEMLKVKLAEETEK
jgi:hypothetical protein